MNSKGKPALTFEWLKNYSENSMNSTILGILIATHITFRVDKKILKILRILWIPKVPRMFSWFEFGIMLKILRILQFYEFQSIQECFQNLNYAENSKNSTILGIPKVTRLWDFIVFYHLDHLLQNIFPGGRIVWIFWLLAPKYPPGGSFVYRSK